MTATFEREANWARDNDQRQAMIRLVAILVTLFLVTIPAKADVALWPRPVPGWTVIQIYGVITPVDLATFQSYTENVDPDATLVIVTGPGGHLLTGLGIGARVREKKLIVGAMDHCTSACALIWIAGETGRKFFYRDRPGVPTSLCFHTSWHRTEALPGHTLPAPYELGNAAIHKYLAAMGYNQEVAEWATTTHITYQLACLTPEIAKKFNIDLWYNTKDGQHYTLPGDHGLLPTTSGR